jgi:thiamine pyrophosphate-dependent acetolactate synthase large subunit-like protein
MAMVMGELGLLRDLNLPVVVIVMNDNALDLIRSAQVRRGKPVYGTEFANPDYELIARGYDIDFYRTSNEATCTDAIRGAVANGRPALIEALIDPISYPTTPKK